MNRRHQTRFFLLLLLAFLTWLINAFPLFIEKYYATGLYVYTSRAARWLLGWLPFSVGDLLYGWAAIWMIRKTARLIKRWRRQQLHRSMLLYYGRRILMICLAVYIGFNWLWGFNYRRLGSAYQLQLQFSRYSNDELARLTDTLQQRMLPVMNDSLAFEPFRNRKNLSRESVAAYTAAAAEFPFLSFQQASVKPHSLYTAGNYLGFLGYLNPFTGEAQMNTTVPILMQPAVLCHEMGHQLGYASESEANFIAFITCRQSRNPAFRYSIYYDMYSYAISDLYYRDSITARRKLDRLPSKIIRDRQAVRQFFRRFKNPVSPFIDWFYDKYLKLNSQPKGRDSYNEVVGWMIAYAKRYGWDKI